MKFREDTQTIINKHNKDFNVSTYSKKCPDYSAYVKGLGGIFSRLYGVTSKPTTADEFRDQVEYVAGIMAIWGFDYWNGKTRHRWGKGSSDAFYGKTAKLKCKGGSIGQLCQGSGGRSRITCCNYGVDTVLQHMSLKRAATDRIKTWAKWYGTVSAKKDLRPGNIVHFYTSVGSRSNPSTWKSWHHVAIVVKVADGKIWLADFGSRFIKSKNPYHYMPINTSGTAGGEYGSYKWAAIKCFNFPEKEQEEPEELIRKNTGFRGYNVDKRTTTPQYIVIHYTGAEGTAADNVAYFNGGDRGASADIFVGHQGEILAYNNDIPHQFTWHCGVGFNPDGSPAFESSHHPYYGKCANANSIGVELCTRKEGDKWTFTGSTIASAVTVTKHLMKLYNIDADHVIRHYDVTGKACPRVPGWGAVGGSSEWEKFKAKLKEEVIPVPKTIKIGSTGKAVKWLQIFLGGLTVDGKFGQKTKAALIKKQKAWGTAAVGSPDGVCGPRTWRKILSLMG